MATGSDDDDDDAAQVLLASNTPLGRIQTTAAIRRVERLGPNMVLFRLFRGTEVTISADRSRSDIVLGPPPPPPPPPPPSGLSFPAPFSTPCAGAAAAQGGGGGVVPDPGHDRALDPPEFSISYPLVLAAPYLTNTSRGGATLHASIGGSSTNSRSSSRKTRRGRDPARAAGPVALAPGQRVTVSGDVTVPFPPSPLSLSSFFPDMGGGGGGGEEPPRPAVYVVCPRAPSGVLAAAGALRDMQGVWGAVCTAGPAGGGGAGTRRGGEEKGAEDEEEEEKGQEDEDEDDEMDGSRSGSGRRRRRSQGRGRRRDRDGDDQTHRLGRRDRADSADEMGDVEMREDSDSDEDGQEGGEYADDDSDGESHEDGDNEHKTYDTDKPSDNGGGIQSTGLFGAPRAGLRVSGQIEAFGRLDVDIVPLLHPGSRARSSRAAARARRRRRWARG